LSRRASGTYLDGAGRPSTREEEPMTETPAEHNGDVSACDAVKRPWITPRLVIHGRVPAMTLAAVSFVTKTDNEPG
jgi:hypothetical protein